MAIFRWGFNSRGRRRRERGIISLTRAVEFENAYRYDEQEFIWGIKSTDEMCDGEASSNTMNDFEIVYNEKDRCYTMSIETFYLFKKEDGEKIYIKNILNKFTDYMLEKKLSINRKPSFYDLQVTGSFDSIEELYTTFRLLANNFIN